MQIDYPFTNADGSGILIKKDGSGIKKLGAGGSVDGEFVVAPSSQLFTSGSYTPNPAPYSPDVTVTPITANYVMINEQYVTVRGTMGLSTTSSGYFAIPFGDLPLGHVLTQKSQVLYGTINNVGPANNNIIGEFISDVEDLDLYINVLRLTCDHIVSSEELHYSFSYTL